MKKICGFTESEIGSFRNTLIHKGYLYIDNLPEGFDHFRFAQEFGKLTPQYDGNIIWSIKADKKFDDHYHSLNTKKLSPHTECYEFPGIPPNYLALWCDVPATCGGGQTTLLDVLPFFNSLDSSEQEAAENEAIKFVSSSGIQSSALGVEAKHCLVTSRDGEAPLIRFSRNCVENSSAIIDSIANKLVEEFESKHDAIHWKKNAFLIWDNQRVVHSRTEFSDRGRELKRVWLVK
ncbi:TauD/TfdA family dioxygenase [Vibrio sp. NTOU-M3]|uniref:TauD/TfdA family dioxygenase n=1 Tax=Vibrio sp. NTOU-M3 TaxID=3234954 RepID=UPI00349F758C